MAKKRVHFRNLILFRFLSFGSGSATFEVEVHCATQQEVHKVVGDAIIISFFFHFSNVATFCKCCQGERPACYRISRYTLKTFDRLFSLLCSFLIFIWFSIAPRQLPKRVSEKLKTAFWAAAWQLFNKKSKQLVLSNMLCILFAWLYLRKVEGNWVICFNLIFKCLTKSASGICYLIALNPGPGWKLDSLCSPNFRIELENRV